MKRVKGTCNHKWKLNFRVIGNVNCARLGQMEGHMTAGVTSLEGGILFLGMKQGNH